MGKKQRRMGLVAVCMAMAFLFGACNGYKVLGQAEVNALVQKTIGIVQEEDGWKQSFRVTVEDKRIGYDSAAQIGYITQPTEYAYYIDGAVYTDEVSADVQTKRALPFSEAETLLWGQSAAVFELLDTYVQEKHVISSAGKLYKDGRRVVTIQFKAGADAYELAATFDAADVFVGMEVYTVNTSGYKVEDVGFFGNEAEAIKETFPSDLDGYERVNE